MRRRDFITFLAGGMTTWPLAGRAQQKPMPVIGFLNGTSPGPDAPRVAAFRQGLSETGYVEGQNLAIELNRRPPIFTALCARVRAREGHGCTAYQTLTYSLRTDIDGDSSEISVA